MIMKQGVRILACVRFSSPSSIVTNCKKMKEIKNFLALAKEKIAQQLFNSNSTIEKAGLSLTKYYGNNTFSNCLTFSVLTYKNRNHLMQHFIIMDRYR